MKRRHPSWRRSSPPDMCPDVSTRVQTLQDNQVKSIRFKYRSLRIRFRETAILEHGLHAGFGSEPRLVHLREVFAIAAREDHLAEAVAVGAGETSVGDEPLVGIVVEHFAPEIGVVAGRISVLP